MLDCIQSCHLRGSRSSSSFNACQVIATGLCPNVADENMQWHFRTHHCSISELVISASNLSGKVQDSSLLKKRDNDTADPSSYRPISNLDTISKVLESWALVRIIPRVLASSNFDRYNQLTEKVTFHRDRTVEDCQWHLRRLWLSSVYNPRRFGSVCSTKAPTPLSRIAGPVGAPWAEEHQTRNSKILPIMIGQNVENTASPTVMQSALKQIRFTRTVLHI